MGMARWSEHKRQPFRVRLRKKTRREEVEQARAAHMCPLKQVDTEYSIKNNKKDDIVVSNCKNTVESQERKSHKMEQRRTVGNGQSKSGKRTIRR